MEIRSKFNGTCTLCGNTFPAGTVINWNKQNGFDIGAALDILRGRAA